jgi:hypothetical protein
MNQATATVIAAIVALVGVLAGLVVGLRRWQRERRDARTADFIKDRQAAYRNLWSTIEGLSVDMRTEALKGEALRGRLRDVNAELLKAGLYIDEPDRDLASSYIKAVERFHEVVSSSNDPGAKITFGDTGAIPPEVMRRVRDLGGAQERATDLRAQLVRRIRVVLNNEAAG